MVPNTSQLVCRGFKQTTTTTTTTNTHTNTHTNATNILPSGAEGTKAVSEARWSADVKVTDAVSARRAAAGAGDVGGVGASEAARAVGAAAGQGQARGSEQARCKVGAVANKRGVVLQRGVLQTQRPTVKEDTPREPRRFVPSNHTTRQHLPLLRINVKRKHVC